MTVEAAPSGEGPALLEKQAARGISIDLINIFDRMVFTVDGAQRDALRPCWKERDRLPDAEDCCKVSAIGVRMRGVPGVMSGFSEPSTAAAYRCCRRWTPTMTISCLVPGEEAELAIRRLHREFGLDREEK